MSAVKNTWSDDENFIVELSISGSGVAFVFPIKELALGGSLSRMMNLKVRETIASNAWMIPPEDLKAAAKEGVAALRILVERHFEIHGSGISP